VNESQVFLNALKLAGAAQRAAYLDEACAGNPRLRADVEALLRAHATDPDFLERPAGSPQETVDSAPAAGSPGEPPRPAGATEQPGVVLAGRYKLVEEIGEGGMGAVWLAQQQEPVKRLVALKVIKPGMDSKQVLARFEAERQALALMDHPNIARVLDAGATPAGRPYFVMELVKGVPITRYGDEHRLTPRQRLELFVPVCQAIQHAHQKGVIHRDIKPSNVLVAQYDGRPVPKVIDFGVAKAAGQPLTERTLVTGLGAVVGTLEYMSPEQAELNQLDIDTRSDVYSLGVLLYELLTGSTPLERRRLKEAPLLEVLRLIREEEPPRPSTRLSSTDELPSVAANRGLEPRKLSGLVRGELDWIVMKALEKDRNRRYETASAFAADVQRYLADEPVLAGPPSARYRLKKFLRRNRGPVLAGMLVLLALVAGIIGTTVGLLQAQAAGDQAREEAWKAGQERDGANAAREEERKAKDAESVQRKRAEAARDHAAITLDAMTSEVAGESLAQQKELTPEQKQLLTTALEYYRELLKETGNDEATRRRLAAAAHRVGMIETRLGRKKEGAVLIRQARDLAARLVTDFPSIREYRENLAACHSNLGLLLHESAKWDRAETEYRAAFALVKELSGGAPKDPRCRQQLAKIHNNLGNLLHDLGKQDRAEKEYRTALAIREQLVKQFPGAPDYRLELAGVHNNLGNLQANLGKRAQAVAEYRLAIDLQEKLAAEFPADRGYRQALATIHNGLGALLLTVGKWEQAEKEHRAALTIQQKLIAEFPVVADYRRQLARSHINLGILQRTLGKPELAEAECRAALDISAKLVKEFPALPECRQQLAHCHHSLAILLAGWGKREQAEVEFRAAIAQRHQLATDFPTIPRYRQDLATSRHNLVVVLYELGKRDQAETECAAAIDLQQNLAAELPSVPDYRGDLARSHSSMGNLLKAKGMSARALTAFRASVALKEKMIAEVPTVPQYRHELATTRNNLGIVLYEMGKADEAEAEYRAAIQLCKQLTTEVPAVPDYRLELCRGQQQLGNLLYQLGRPDEAETACRAAIGGLEHLMTAFPAHPDYRLQLVLSHASLGTLLLRVERPKQAETEFRAALTLCSELAARFPSVPKYQRQLVQSHLGVGTALRASGKYEQAETELRAARALCTQLIAEYPRVVDYSSDLAYVHNHLAIALQAMGKRPQAETELRASIKLWRQLAAEFPAIANHTIELGAVLCNLGALLRENGKPQDALPLFDEAIATLLPHARQERSLPTAQQHLRNSYRGRAEALDLLRRHGRAVKDWEKALELSSGSSRTFYQWRLLLSRASAGEFDQAMKDADEVARNGSREMVYACARVYALIHADTRDDKPAARAVELLRRAAARGFRDAAALKHDAAFDSLRKRDDFRRLVTELEKGP
jgi:serine/threonine protein kinase/tetratricopeptide (TPR) repeat protein